MTKLRNASRKLSPLGLTVLRVTAGIVMTVHGWMKLTDYAGWQESLTSMGMPYPEVFAPIAIACEFAGGIGLILGLLTPIAALGVLASMLTAVFLVHLPNGLLAKDGGFEYPLILACVALFFVVRGGGPISVDHLIFGRTRHEDDREVRRREWREAHV